MQGGLRGPKNFHGIDSLTLKGDFNRQRTGSRIFHGKGAVSSQGRVRAYEFWDMKKASEQPAFWMCSA